MQWLLGSVIRTFDYPNCRWSQLVRIIDVLLYLQLIIPFTIQPHNLRITPMEMRNTIGSTPVQVLIKVRVGGREV